MRTNHLTRLLHDDNGATAVEYGLIVALVALAAVTSIVGVGNEVNSKFESIETHYSAANGS